MNELYSERLVTLLSLTADELVDAALRQLHGEGYTDLRYHHFLHVSRWLEPAGIRPSELARRAGVSRQFMSELVAELESLGYVTRLPDPSDSRARLVVPAKRGLEANAVLQAYWRELEGQLEQRYGPQRVNDMTELLTTFREALR